MKRVLAIILLLVFVVGLFTGCGETSENNSSNTSNNNSSDDKKGNNDDSMQTEEVLELVFAQSIAITSLDPAGMQPQGYPSGYEASFAIHNGLVRFDEELNFTPDLAETWTTSSDGLEWTFNLRKDVKFHDGSDFDADAVVSQYNRMIDNEVNIGAYSLWKPIIKIEKIDEFTVKITTETPYSAFLNVMAHGSALIPSPTVVESDAEGYGLNPVGTGPYKLEKFEPGTELVLTRNDDYYEGTPAYNKLTFRYVGDASARISALQSGQVDVIDAVPSEYAAQLKQDSNINVIAKPGLQVFGVGINMNNTALQDKAVRQAMNYAINKEAIVSTLFMGFATPLTSPLALNTTGSVVLDEYAFNVDKANEILDNASWVKESDGIRSKDGEKLDFTFIVPDGMYPKDVILSETIQNQLKQVGINTTINKVEKSTYWDQLKVPEADTSYDMALWGYNPSHGNGQIHLESLFTSNASTTEKPGLWNFIWYNNEQVDKLLSDAKQQVVSSEFADSMKQAQEIIWEDSPYIWLYSNNIITATRADIENVIVLPVVFTLVHRMQ